MSITLNIENKNSAISITNENKPTGGTFGDSPTRTFADGGTFGQPAMFIAKEAKNNLVITNEDKL